MVMRYAHHYPEILRASIEVMDSIRNLDIDKFIAKLSQSPKNAGKLVSTDAYRIA
jgi:hypothetical protein